MFRFFYYTSKRGSQIKPSKRLTWPQMSRCSPVLSSKMRQAGVMTFSQEPIEPDAIVQLTILQDLASIASIRPGAIPLLVSGGRKGE